MLMHLLRRSAAWLAVSILPLLLFTLAASYSLQRSFGTPEPIKDILRDSGIYTSAVDTFLEATDNPNEEGGGGISVDNPVVQNAFKKSFPPELIQNSTEDFIDSIYAWAEGKTPTPQFTIDLSQAKNTFVSEVAAGAEARAASLPACPRGQTSFEDPFAATCLPRGVPPSAAGDKIRQELAGGEEKFLKDPVITANSLKSKDNKPAFSEDSALPENYQRIKKIPAILAILTVVVLAAVILLSDSRVQGLKRVGITLLIVGLFLLVSAWAVNSLVSKQASSIINFENVNLRNKVQAIVKDISETASKNFMLAGGVYAGLGAVGTGGAIYLGRRKHTTHQEPAEKAEESKSLKEKSGKEKSDDTPKT